MIETEEKYRRIAEAEFYIPASDDAEPQLILSVRVWRGGYAGPGGHWAAQLFTGTHGDAVRISDLCGDLPHPKALHEIAMSAAYRMAHPDFGRTCPTDNGGPLDRLCSWWMNNGVA